VGKRPARPAAQPGLAFIGSPLDRAPDRRRDPHWVDDMRDRLDAASLVLSERGLWMDDGHLLLIAPGAGSVFLGLDGERPLFATDGDSERGHPAGLREAASELPAGEAALAAYAASLLSWHRRHGFCANCATATESVDGGHERRCPNCDAHHFPRTDPVVIMAVHDGADRLLLGRQPSWPEHRYSTLAGFVEPGETLEEAVAREVREEAGVEIEGPRYHSSQPWPFPASLMLGFSAQWRSGLPRRQEEEMDDVRWFSRDEVAAALRGEGPLALPDRYAIARRLIEAWLDEGLHMRPRTG
jgi:NAD+ diphosphatase